MNATGRDRRIRHLRFTCEREEHARRGSLLLEDALRTASLGDEGRIVVIRSLALGPLSAQASSIAWSTRLEQRMRVIRDNAVFAASPAAGGADAVWFASEVEAWTTLAERTARGAPSGEWFWNSVAPGWTSRLNANETLRLAFQRVVEAGGWPASAVLARRLAKTGSLAALLGAISSAEANQALAGVWECAPERALAGDSSGGSDLIEWTQPWLACALNLLPETSTDPRLRWLITVAISLETRTPPTATRSSQALQALLRHFTDQSEPHVPARIKKPLGATARPPSDVELVAEAEPASAQSPDGVVTAYGGLFFLLPLFARLRIAELPEPANAAWQTLRAVFNHCRGQRGDDLQQILPGLELREEVSFSLLRPDANATTAGDWELHTSWQPFQLARWRRVWRVLLDASGRLPLAAWRREIMKPNAEFRARRAADIIRKNFECYRVRRAPDFPHEHNPLVVALALGAHRLCRRQTGLGLKALVHRPARVAITDTHVDVFLRVASADVRIRRAALDVDPGWMPWLGRVVAFHYLIHD